MQAIHIEPSGDQLLLVYTPDDRWFPRSIIEEFKLKGSFSLRKTFEFHMHHLVSPNLEGADPESPDLDDREYVFELGRRENEYFRILKEVVGTKNSFHFHDSIPLKEKHFIAKRNISILRRIDELVQQDVYIGGSNPDAMPVEVYASMLAQFPSSDELTRYARARVGASIADYFETASDTVLNFEKYMDKRLVARDSDILISFLPQELEKFKALKVKLEEMLASENIYNERSWQNEILDIIRLLYPKYILVFSGTPVLDAISKKIRRLDLLLVDASGHVDVIEIKKPFDNCIVSRRQYRGNYPPSKELTGAVMQTEKYILHLNKWGHKGEEELNRRYASQLPAGLRLRITNPKGIIIMGRDHNLNPDERADFEVIKRKYSNMIDIVTYDDLLARLGFVIDQLRGVHPKGSGPKP